MDYRSEGLQEVGLSAGCGRNEFDRSLLHCSFFRRFSEQELANPSGREFLRLRWARLGATVARGDDFTSVLADSAVDVPAKAVLEDLTISSGIPGRLPRKNLVIHPNSGPRIAHSDSGLPGKVFGPRYILVKGRAIVNPLLPKISPATEFDFKASTMTVSRGDRS